MTFWKWSTTALTNVNVDDTINWQEGQAPSSVNNSARALMAAAAKYRDDTSAKIDSGGAADAYTVTSNQSLTALTDGFTIAFRASDTNTGASTLAVDGLTAKPLRMFTGTALLAGKILTGSLYVATYRSDTDEWLLMGAFPDTPQSVIPAGTRMLFQQTAAPTGFTKVTDHNDKALRVVSGSVVNGGSVAFETAFASKSVTGTVGATTLTVNQIPLHGHPVRYSPSTSSDTNVSGGIALDDNNAGNYGAHTSALSDTVGEQIGGTGGGASHTHSFTGTAIDLDVAFVDVIIATKD